MDQKNEKFPATSTAVRYEKIKKKEEKKKGLSTWYLPLAFMLFPLQLRYMALHGVTWRHTIALE
jgi:hypothetical protein